MPDKNETEAELDAADAAASDVSPEAKAEIARLAKITKAAKRLKPTTAQGEVGAQFGVPADPLKDIDIEASKTAARDMLAKRRAAQTVAQAVGEGMSFLLCKYCNGPGIFMAGRPARLTKDNWWSSYKARGEGEDNTRPFCQCCYAETKQKRYLQCLHDSRMEDGMQVTIAFMPMSEYVISMNADEVEQYRTAMNAKHAEAAHA